MRNCAIEFLVKRITLAAFVAAAVVCGGSKHPQSAPPMVGRVAPNAPPVGATAPSRPSDAPNGEGAAFVRAASTDLSRAIEGNRPYQLGADKGRALPVDASDVARGYRFVGEATEDIVYTMPKDGMEVGNWGRRGTFGEWLRYELGWAFPLGSNNTSYSSFSVFNDGKIRPTPRDRSHEICAVGIPMLAMQGASRFWVCDGSGGETTLTWENFYLNADTNAPINAQIVLCESGDFVTRSNEVARYYTRIDLNDWDGDGLANEIDDEPYTSNGDCFGTGEGWWVANAAAVAATNANPEAYYWLEFAATADRTRVAVTCDGASDLGDMVVIARTNQVCRVPLLIGATYAVRATAPLTGIEVSDENASITFNDKIQVSAARSVSEPYQGDWGQSHPSSDFASQSSSLRSSGDTVPLRPLYQSGPTNAAMQRVEGNAPYRAVAWGRASADFNIDYPLEFFFVPPPLDSGRTDYALTSTPVNVGAEIASLSGVCCTNVTAGDYFNWDCRTGCGCGGAARAVYAAVLWEGYSRSFEWWGECPCGEVAETNEVHDATRPYLVMTMPRVLYTNGDGNAEQGDVATLHLEFHSPVPTNGTLELSYDTSDIAVMTTSNTTDKTLTEVKWDAADFTATNLYAMGMWVGWAGEPSVLVFKWRDVDGALIMAQTNRFHVYHPIANIVNNTLYDNGDLCNPAAIVVGTNACFALEFFSIHPPAGDIKWSITEGVAEFVGGRTGERVRVRSDRPNQKVVLEARIGDSVSRPIQFPAYVVDPVTVKATVWIVGNDEGTYYARSAEEMQSMMAEVNSIFKQIGVSFYIDSISFTNRSEWLDLRDANGECSGSKRGSLVNIAQHTGGVEIYFVDVVADGKVGNNNPFGAVISSRGDAETLAHELGHACNLNYNIGTHDIYTRNKRADGTVAELEKSVIVCEANLPGDWNNGTGYRYYEYAMNGDYETKGLLLRDLIPRLLMCGQATSEPRRDMPIGRVHGYTMGGLETLVDVGFFVEGQRKLPSHE